MSIRPHERRPRFVYGMERARRLRVVLWLALTLGVFVAVLEAGALGESDADRRLLLTALVIYLVVAVLAGITLWRLAARDATTRLTATSTGTFLAIVGVLTVETVFGLLSMLLGLGLLALALLPDEPEQLR